MECPRSCYLECCAHSVVMSEVKRTFGCCFTELHPAGTSVVFEVYVETSSPGRRGDCPAWEELGLQTARRRETHAPSQPQPLTAGIKACV